eukprot:501139-Pelagomonas_calceolata.AAC.4
MDCWSNACLPACPTQSLKTEKQNLHAPVASINHVHSLRVEFMQTHTSGPLRHMQPAFQCNIHLHPQAR